MLKRIAKIKNKRKRKNNNKKKIKYQTISRKTKI